MDTTRQYVFFNTAQLTNYTLEAGSSLELTSQMKKGALLIVPQGFSGSADRAYNTVLLQFDVHVL